MMLISRKNTYFMPFKHVYNRIANYISQFINKLNDAS